MKICNLGTSAFCLSIAAAALTGCATGSLPDLDTSTGPQHAATSVKRGAPAGVLGDLLYVSSNTGGFAGEVSYYTWPELKFVGTLSGVPGGAAICVDRDQNVWIPVNGAIDRVAHGASKPNKALSDPYGFAVDCAVDPATGNLAVVDAGIGASNGNVVIYKNAKGSGTKYTIQGDPSPSFAGYDNNGNLFVDGEDVSSSAFAELAAGVSAFTNLALNQNIGTPGTIQWDGQYLAVEDEETNVIYQFAISGYGGTAQGSTTLADSQAVEQFFVPLSASQKHPQGTKVVGADALGDSVSVWNYPSGGKPTKTLGGFFVPTGAAISKGTP